MACSFVAVVSCWGVVDVGVEVLSREEDLQEILWYSVLLLSSLSLTAFLQCLPSFSNTHTSSSSSSLSSSLHAGSLNRSRVTHTHPHASHHNSNFLVVLVLLFSFFAAVAGWGLVDAVVCVAAGGEAGLKVFFYFCFFACTSVFVVLYVCLLDPSFNLDVVANFV
ncbi:transmembrane protein [Cystoisospora suis]|uniref:Transmembrane protein n=1 Tax=Cystoisospora suis TaxID=483139 RepID=A0A2C6KHX8_9APIC|nr:transmembrane protein [Cystoisospora suis]